MEENLWNKIFVKETDDTVIQLFRYLFVGGFAFGVDYAVSIIAVKGFGLYEVYATIISFVMGLVANYILSSLWIFKKRRINNKGFDFAAFGAIGLIGLALKAGLVWILTELPELDILISNPAATVIVFIWNFLARKYLLYSRKG